MSKITQEKKELKAKGKNTDADHRKQRSRSDEKKAPKQKKTVDGIPNYGKCVTCIHFPHKVRGETQPCKILKKYVARKAEHPECYKSKIGD